MLINLGLQSKDSKDLGLKYRIFLAKMTAVDIDKYPKAEKATIKDKVLKEGEKYRYLDSKVDALKVNVEPGENMFKGVPKVSVFVEGVSPEALQYMYDNNGELFNMIIERCADAQKFIMGDPCSGGMRMQYTAIGEQEGGIAGTTIEFTGGQCTQPLLFYSGEVEVAEDTTDEGVQSFAVKTTKSTPKE